MSITAGPDTQGVSTRPYLIRALHQWCTDHGFTPYLAVYVDAQVRVPQEYVKNGEIVLNVGHDATSALSLGNEFIEFKARFGGVARDIVVPVDHVLAIYARENGQGMAFPVPQAAAGNSREADTILQGTEQPPAVASSSAPGLRLATSEPATPPTDTPPSEPPPTTSPGGGRPALKRVK